MIDWQQVQQLQEDVGKEEMEEVIELFMSEVDEAMEKLEANYAGMVPSDRSAAFHFLKGCASNLGFRAFGTKCSLGEEATKDGNDPSFQISELVAIYENSKQVFFQNYHVELG